MEMKRKYVAILMGIVMTATILNGCGKNSDTETDSPQTTVEAAEEESTEEFQEAESVLGEVTAVNEESITIAVGTQKEMSEQGDGEKPEGRPEGERGEAPEGENDEAPEEQPGGDNGEKPSMLDLTGEEQTITLTEDTVITRISMERQEEKPGDSEVETVEEESTDNGTEQESNAQEIPRQTTETIALSDIGEGDVVSVTFDEDGNAATITVQSMGGGPGMGGGPTQSQGVDSYEATNEYKENITVDGEELTSAGTDENAVLVDGNAEVVLKNVTVSRNSSDSTGGDNSSFYGVGAAILGTEGNTYISNSAVNTDAAGGAGVFAYGNSKVYISDSTITTSQDTSGGIHAAGGGTLYAWDLEVETNGESSAAIRSDRGGGTMVVNGGTYTSNGIGSPAVYCTADIAVNNSKLTANGSEAICIEGLNSLRLYDCDITGNMSDDSQNDCTWTMIVYQSMSGDSEVGNSTLQIDGGSITSENGGLIYTTNTESTITLKNVDITYNDDSEFFLQCTGNNNQRGWGQNGNNGSDCLFTAITQDMKGDVIWDSISNLDFYMTEGSSLTGAIVKDETYAGNGGDGYCNVYIDKGSVWTVTGNSTVSNLMCEGDIIDDSGKTVSIVGSDGTVYVDGDSEYTITVENYSNSVDLSGADKVDEWSSYETDKPEALL